MMVIFRALDLSFPDHCTFWAACNLAYFSFLQQSLLSPTWLAFCPQSIWDSLMLQWIPCHLHHAYSFASRPAKTDPFYKDCFLHTDRGEFPLCAIHPLLACLTLRGNAPGPLFLFQDI